MCKRTRWHSFCCPSHAYVCVTHCVLCIFVLLQGSLLPRTLRPWNSSMCVTVQSVDEPFTNTRPDQTVFGMRKLHYLGLEPCISSSPWQDFVFQSDGTILAPAVGMCVTKKCDPHPGLLCLDECASQGSFDAMMPQTFIIEANNNNTIRSAYSPDSFWFSRPSLAGQPSGTYSWLLKVGITEVGIVGETNKFIVALKGKL